jgi:methylmalonyl-CoA mutase N-terminal domain/subunit
MKSKKMRYHVQAAKIYRHHYRPSFNILRLLKSVLAVIMHGSSAAAAVPHRHK